MKEFFAVIFWVLCVCLGAKAAFEIPRSAVIELHEPPSNRSYPLFIKLPRSYESGNQINYHVIYLTDAWYNFQVVSGATRFL